jgi:hypothetical protein
VVNWGAVPIAGLMETGFLQRSGIWRVVKVPTPRSMPGEVKDQAGGWPVSFRPIRVHRFSAKVVHSKGWRWGAVSATPCARGYPQR